MRSKFRASEPEARLGFTHLRSISSLCQLERWTPNNFEKISFPRPLRADMTFSIITPSYRQSDWLKLCIASVADQEVAAEHIIQDAGSDDGTQTWLPHDQRVKAFIEKDA